MESPTVEISRGLEALRLAGRVEGLLKHSTLPTQMSSTTEEEKPTSLTQPASRTNAAPAPNKLTQCSMPASKPTTSIQEESLSPCICPCHSRESQTRPHSHTSVPFSRPPCPCSIGGGLCQRPNSSTDSSLLQAPSRDPRCLDGSCITESFSTLSVSGCPGYVGSQAVVPLPRSCREEAGAASCVNYLDDTTVDDLAGYLDEIMFIPKPMSEMAELMYT